MTSVFVKTGDVTKDVEVDALVTLINSECMWFGGIDGAIMRVAGNLYHSQAMGIPLKDGKIVVAKKGLHSHAGSFKDVIFVVDDLLSPLGDLIYSALRETKVQGYKTVAFPLMRTGVMLGTVEPNMEAVVDQIKVAIDKFLADDDWNLQIYIVVFNNPDAVKLLLDSSMIK
ncbi:MAG TPA: hypothetical protein VLH94_03865 [Spirochaetia bacterium]|nr:hypothetical protein [Spirochaetia bacterium]